VSWRIRKKYVYAVDVVNSSINISMAGEEKELEIHGLRCTHASIYRQEVIPVLQQRFVIVMSCRFHAGKGCFEYGTWEVFRFKLLDAGVEQLALSLGKASDYEGAEIYCCIQAA